ncbi:MAG: serine hydrolase [Nostocaceae cyanobacterium]|nr:serine hydrolase [Nostocaceae cyanobacterium]
MTSPITPQITPEAALENFFTTEEQIDTELFTDSVLMQVPVTQIKNIITDIKNQLGSYQGVEKSGQEYLVTFTQGSVLIKITINTQGKIVGLLFKPPKLKISSLEQAVAELKSLPGEVSFLVKEDSEILVALNSTTPLAVGSAFKLAVLKVLKSQIASLQRSWKDIVILQPDDKKLPSGMLRTWPDGSPLTLQTLASLMISISDNTATDILINLIGRESIESISPRNSPFLTTREMFVLKSSQNRQLLQRYRQGNENERRLLLAELAKLPRPDLLNEFEGTLDVEWFFTSEELCRLIEEVANLPLMSINPGIANPNDWEEVAFKGGSEPGVFNLTTWLKGKNGKNYCVVATWNNKDAPVDESKISALYGGVISFLADETK